MPLLFACNQVSTLYPASYLTPPCLGLCPKNLPHTLFSPAGRCLTPARPRPGGPPSCCRVPRELTPALPGLYATHPSPASSPRPPPARVSTCHLPLYFRPMGPTRRPAWSPQPGSGLQSPDRDNPKDSELQVGQYHLLNVTLPPASPCPTVTAFTETPSFLLDSGNSLFMGLTFPVTQFLIFELLS